MSVVVETTVGDITIDLFYKECPRACLNFIKLCKLKYYNLNLFHTVQNNFIAQTGDPTGTGKGGDSIFGQLYGDQARFFEVDLPLGLKHKKVGTVSLVSCGENKFGSQFFITLAENLDSLDGKHCIIGEVTEGLDTVTKLNEVIGDKEDRPYQDVRITHTVILEDPFPDPDDFKAPDASPVPTKDILESGRIAPDEDLDDFAGQSREEIEEYIKDKEARAQATILEMIGDLPTADVAPPENVLFVCKLNPVTSDDDLAIIFSRFGKIKSCEVIRDRVSGKSLQYAFVEFDNPKSAEDAYFKMDNVLIDDRRIHVDFSQSVSNLKWKGKGRGGYADDFDPEKHERKPKKSVEREDRRERDDRSISPNDLTIKKPSKKSLRKRSDSRENGKSPSRSPQKRRRNSSERNRSPSFRRRSPPLRRSPRGWNNGRQGQDRFWNGNGNGRYQQRGRSPAWGRNRRDDFGGRDFNRRGGWRSPPRRQEQRPPRYWDDRAFERDERHIEREIREHYDSRTRRDGRSGERDHGRMARDSESRDRRTRDSEVRDKRRRSGDRESESRDRRERSESKAKSRERSESPDKKKKKKARKRSQSRDRSRKDKRTSRSSSRDGKSQSRERSRRRDRSRSESVEKPKAPTPPPALAPVVEMSYDKFGFLVRKVIPPEGCKDDEVEASKRDKDKQWSDSRDRSRERKRSRSRSKRSRSADRRHRRRSQDRSRQRSSTPNPDKRRRRQPTPQGRRRGGRNVSQEEMRKRSPSHDRSASPPTKKRSPSPEKPKKVRDVSSDREDSKRKKAKSGSESSEGESSGEEQKKKKRKKTKSKKKRSKKGSESDGSESGSESSAASDSSSGAEKKKRSKKKKHKK